MAAGSLEKTSNSYEGRQLRLVVSQNKTTINWTLYSEGGSSTYYSIYNTKITIAGTTVYNPGTVYYTDKKFPAAKGSKSGSITIAKGTKSIKVVFMGTVWYNRTTDYGDTMTLNTTYNAPFYNSVSSSPARTTATLTASINTDGASISSGGWDVSADGGSTWTYYSGGPTSSTITGLTPNTKYSYRGYVKTEGGSANSSWSTFTTSGNAPVITGVYPTVSRTTVSLADNLITYDTNSSFKSSLVKYGTTTSYGLTSSSVTLSDLTPNTTYYYSMTVTDNWGRTSNAVTGSFKTTGYNPTIDSCQVADIDQNTATMTYGATFDINDSYKSLRWDYGTTESYGLYKTEGVILDGLEPFTTYYYMLTITSTEGRESYTTGMFSTDPATVTITALGVSEITTTTAKVSYTFNNPSGIAPINRIETIITKEGEEGLRYTTINVPVPYTRECTDLEPGSKYTYQTRVGTLGQTGTIYYSDWVTIEFETLASTPFSKIDADGTVKRYKGYALGKADIYNGYTSEWQNGTYSATAVGAKIVFNSTGAGVAKVKPIEVLPNEKYTFDFPSQAFSGSVMIVETDSNDIVTNAWSMATGGSSTYQTKSSTTRIYISYSESSTSTSFILNEATAKYITFHLYKTAQKVALDNDSIVVLNDKLRYIDIVQKNYTENGTLVEAADIVEVDVINGGGDNIALNKTIKLINAEVMEGEDKDITNGSHDDSTWLGIYPKVSGEDMIVRVDLGEEISYENVSYIKLWRKYSGGAIYSASRLFGRDADEQLTWKFQSYKIEGTYQETAEGYTGYVRHQRASHTSTIEAVTLDPTTTTIDGVNINVSADWSLYIPLVIDDLTTYRVDAIIAANNGKLLKADIGDLTALKTTEKNSIVEAINELWNDWYKIEEDYTALDFVLDSLLC